MTSGSEPGASWDPTWEEIFQRQDWGKYPPEHLVRFVARHWYAAPLRSGISLLDLGSGPGASTWFAAREGFSVAAIDGSPTAVAKLRVRLSDEGLTADARVGDMASLPWPDSYFDGVIDNASMYANRFEDCKRIVSEVRRVLKPGGVFLSVSFTDRSWGWGLGNEVEHGGFTAVSAGPFMGKGFSLMLGRAQLAELFRDFQRVTVDRVSHTLGAEAHTIEMWVVTCEM